MDLIEIPTEETPREDISLKEIRKNIKKFDTKLKIYKENPYSYNAVSLKKNSPITPTADQMATNPIYNAVGKVLGIDTTLEWNQYYDKIYQISEWAKKKVGKDDLKRILRLISTKASSVPAMSARRIDDLYIYIGLTK